MILWIRFGHFSNVTAQFVIFSCFPFSGNICGDKLLRLTGWIFFFLLLLLCTRVFVIRWQMVVTLGAKKFSLPGSFHVNGCENCLANFVEENPTFFLITFCYGFPPIFLGTPRRLWRLPFNRGDIVLLYWLFAAAPPLHLIAPLLVKEITQLPHCGVYSGPPVGGKKYSRLMER